MFLQIKKYLAIAKFNKDKSQIFLLFFNETMNEKSLSVQGAFFLSLL